MVKTGNFQPMIESVRWSEIEIANVKGKSRLITSKSVQPLKIFNPETYDNTCHVMLSNYGGGMVSGDKINLDIKGRSSTTTFLNTQANGRVYKALNEATCEQHVRGDLEENATLMFFPDPVVLHEASIFNQKQEWNLEKNSLLFLLDWYSSGRSDAGEKFKFKGLNTELRIKVDGKLKVVDKFSFEPASHIPSSPSNFDKYHTFLSAFLVGDETDPRFIKLSNKLSDLKTKGNDEMTFKLAGKNAVVSFSKAKEGVVILRAIGKSRTDIEEACGQILKVTSLAAFMIQQNLAARV